MKYALWSFGSAIGALICEAFLDGANIGNLMGWGLGIMVMAMHDAVFS